MRRLAFRIFVIVIIGSVAFATSSAFFSDRETSTTNNFTAGKLDLKVNGQDNPSGIVTLSDMKPGDDRIATKTLYVDNNPAKVFLHLKDLVPDQGEQTEPETLEENGVPKFDVQNYITYDLVVGNSTLITSGSLTPLTDAVSCWIPLGTIPGATTVTMLQSFHFDQSVTNWAQGDTLSFTEEFLAQLINDPTIPVTGTGRVWDPEHKRCTPAPSTPTPTPTTTPSPTSTPSLTPTPALTPTPDPFVDDVTAVSGTYGHCCDVNNLASDLATAKAVVTGAPDSPPNFNFIQISQNSSVTSMFVDNKAFNGGGADIRIHIYDTLFPASALVEVSADCLSYSNAGIHLDTANVDIDLATVAPPLTEARCVRITSQTAALDDPYPTLGFDLDAIEALNNTAP